MKRRFLSILLATAGTVLLTVAPALALDLGGHDRDGTVFGLFLGAGWNSLEFDDEDGTQKTDTQVDFSGGFSVGWARDDHLLGSISFFGWKAGWDYDYRSLSARTYSFLLDIAWFPRGEGFWIKGGIGRGILDFSTVTTLARVTRQESGWEWLLGAGYEFRVSDQAALGVAYDYRYLGIDQFEEYSNVKRPSNNWFLSIRFYM